MARSARLERVLDDGYAVCSAPGVEANWYAVDESTPWVWDNVRRIRGCEGTEEYSVRTR
jgi:hypothetical protein